MGVYSKHKLCLALCVVLSACESSQTAVQNTSSAGVGIDVTTEEVRSMPPVGQYGSVNDLAFYGTALEVTKGQDQRLKVDVEVVGGNGHSCGFTGVWDETQKAFKSVGLESPTEQESDTSAPAQEPCVVVFSEDSAMPGRFKFSANTGDWACRSLCGESVELAGEVQLIPSDCGNLLRLEKLTSPNDVIQAVSQQQLPMCWQFKSAYSRVHLLLYKAQAHLKLKQKAECLEAFSDPAIQVLYTDPSEAAVGAEEAEYVLRYQKRVDQLKRQCKA